MGGSLDLCRVRRHALKNPIGVITALSILFACVVDRMLIMCDRGNSLFLSFFSLWCRIYEHRELHSNVIFDFKAFISSPTRLL